MNHWIRKILIEKQLTFCSFPIKIKPNFYLKLNTITREVP
jgi:hypothetical protein